MQKYGQKIVFFGTADYAVACLDALVENGLKVVAVVTATDKPAGRGQKLTFSPVKEAALKHNLPVLQPKNMKSPEFQEELRSFQADIQVVVAFRMMPEAVWSMPPLGTINVHASLLPQYRGAAPINWAIINGEKETGVTTFRLQQEIDTGDILLSAKTEIEEADTFETLYEKLKKSGAEILIKTLIGIFENSIKPSKQSDEKELRNAPKIFPETGILDFKKPVREVFNLIRGLNPFPAARFYLDGKMYKVFAVSCLETDTEIHPAGTFISNNKSFLHIFCSGGYIDVKEIQAEGKKRMGIKEFFNGNKLPV